VPLRIASIFAHLNPPIDILFNITSPSIFSSRTMGKNSKNGKGNLPKEGSLIVKNAAGTKLSNISEAVAWNAANPPKVRAQVESNPSLEIRLSAVHVPMQLQGLAQPQSGSGGQVRGGRVHGR
jgi:hypothetical protein